MRIRFKQLSNGNQSIYLDYYTGDVIRKENYVGGKRKYEFLKLYLIPERTREDKAKNEVTLALAKAIQSKRIVEVQNDAHGFQNTNKSRVNLLDYLEKNRQLDNTIIVYTSDQGFYMGEHGLVDKRLMYEEALRMPLVIRYP